jgi:uncharacterized membrane protein (DUF106 family)
MDLEFNPQVSVANVITVLLTLAVGLGAWTNVRSQVEYNKNAIEQTQSHAEEMKKDLAELKTAMAVVTLSVEHSQQERAEIKENQKQILNILRNK